MAGLATESWQQRCQKGGILSVVSANCRWASHQLRKRSRKQICPRKQASRYRSPLQSCAGARGFAVQPRSTGERLQYINRQQFRRLEEHTACPSLHGRCKVLRANCMFHRISHSTAPHAGKQRRTKLTSSSMFPVNAEQLMQVTDMRFFFCRTSNVNSSCMSPMMSTEFAPPLSSNVLCVCRIWFLHSMTHACQVHCSKSIIRSST